MLYICKSDDTCASAIKRPDGTYVSVMITISGETTSPSPKLDATNAGYNTLVAVLRTLRFKSAGLPL